MKKSRVLALTLISLLIGLVGTQVQALTVASKTATAPLTYPITYPKMNTDISGTVRYLNGPANGVTIIATKTDKSVQFTATTQKDGTYTVIVVPGDYIVKAQDARGTQFSPASYTVHVADYSMGGIDFSQAAPTLISGK